MSQRRKLSDILHGGPKPIGSAVDVVLERAEHKAIETKYQGYLFRSRLEAKWAAFFDLCGWKWSYEPLDCGGWIPDFAIGEMATLVEVKPFFELDQWNETIAKIRNSSVGAQDVLLLGADATWAGMDNLELPVIGYSVYGQSQSDAINPSTYPPDCEPQPIHFGWTSSNGKLGQ